jgi:aminoglycoside 6-adenylyltransferase
MSDAVPFIPSSNDDRHADIVANLLLWAERTENIRAVIQTGSASRASGAVDRFSDRDIELICRDPTPLLEDDSWIHAIAPVWVVLYLENDPGNFEQRLVFFVGGRKVDFTVADQTRLDAMRENGHLDSLYERGYRVLLDKDGLAAGLPVSTGRSPSRPLPTEAEFTATVAEFWFEAAHMPTYLTREDLWVVKLRDGAMKEMLLRLLEWHTLYTQGPDTDVWHIGTKMKRWVDPGIWIELQDVFGHFDTTDSVRALTATMRLFKRLTHDVAVYAGFTVPEAERHIEAYVLGLTDAVCVADCT